jgi:hypothetical protein
MQEPSACITAREVKFSEAISSRPWTWFSGCVLCCGGDDDDERNGSDGGRQQMQKSR